MKKIPAVSGRTYLISVPKSVVPLSTRRSRIKRLIREALRLRGGVQPPEGKAFYFKVTAPVAENTRLHQVDRIITTLLMGFDK